MCKPLYAVYDQVWFMFCVTISGVHLGQMQYGTRLFVILLWTVVSQAKTDYGNKSSKLSDCRI